MTDYAYVRDFLRPQHAIDRLQTIAGVIRVPGKKPFLRTHLKIIIDLQQNYINNVYAPIRKYCAFHYR